MFSAHLVARFIVERHFVGMCACLKGAHRAANNRATPVPTISLELVLLNRGSQIATVAYT